jgi:CBS domain-containing protein
MREVREILSSPVITATPHEPADDAWTRMRAHQVHHLVVVSEGHIVGLLDARDLSGPNGGATRRMGRRVADLMVGDVVPVSPRTSIARAAAVMQEQEILCLPVVERGELVGVITAFDLLGVLAKEPPSETPATAKVRHTEERT